MKTSFISNLSVANAMRSTINQVQSELIDAQKEVVSGRYANIGEELGGRTARSLNLHRDLDRMGNILSTNSVVTQRLSSTQKALENISNAAQTGLNTLVALAGSTDATQLGTAAQTMRDVIDQFTSAANTSVNGEFVLAGIDTDNQPVSSYLADGSPAKAAFDAAFSGYFGFTQTDPQTNTITPTQMQGFMDTVVQPMFLTPGGDWESNWSSASDTPMTSRISQTEVVQTSTTTNETGFRYLAMASVVGIELMNLPLTSDTRAVVTDSAIDFMGRAIQGVDSQRSQLGLSENRVSVANSTLQAQVDIIKTNLDDLEGVDVYAASTKITNLKNQMEISYTLTARLNELSLVNSL